MTLDDDLSWPEGSEIPGLLERWLGLAWLGLIVIDGSTL